MAMDEGRGTDVGRRRFLATSAAGAAALVCAPAIAKSGAGIIGHEFGLHAGSDLGAGWTIESVQGPDAGSLRVVAIHSSGRRANVAICRTEAGARPMATTGRVDLFLMNDGRNGLRLTPDDEVAIVERIAKFVAGREDSLPGADALVGQQERLVRFLPSDHLAPSEG